MRHGYDKGVSFFYLSKDLYQVNNNHIIIRPLASTDIDIIVASFTAANWHKPISIFETYWQEQQQGTRQMWVAYMKYQFVGYIALQWQSKYIPFFEKCIPEIMDLNVLPAFCKQVVGSKLLDVAEEMASTKTDQVGIGVGLYGDYGSAQRLYVKHGYVPDGRGVTYNYQPITPGNKVALDDELVLWFEKRLK